MRGVLRTIGIAKLAAIILCAPIAPAFAVLPGEQLSDPILEARALAISREIRCVVCQNQNIDDSSAPLARDMRILVRERLTAGDSDVEVVDYLVARYGNFVLLKPPFQLNTLVLWLAPFAVFVMALTVLVLQIRTRRNSADLNPLSPEEEERLAHLLGDAGSGEIKRQENYV